MELLCAFEQGDGLGVVWDFSGGDDYFEGELGVDIYNQMDLVSEEGVGFGLMSPLGIRVGIFSEALALAGAVADLDAELIGARPDVGGIHRRVDVLLDQAYGNSLRDELMQDPIEGILSQAITKMSKGRMGRGLQEIESAKETESGVITKDSSKFAVGVNLAQIYEKLSFEQRERIVALLFV